MMDKRVMEWAGGDITKVNIDPKNKDKLYKKWGQTAASTSENLPA